MPPVLLDAVVVTATRAATSAFEVPAAIAWVDATDIRAAGPQVNLSEALARVPGIAALNRQNYAQDLQVSIRGFGSRSTFGIRGVRLIIDGIPATMPDGQGQASTVSLPSAARIEILRGPLAQLYGNAAGGVVQVFTDLESPSQSGVDATAGSDAQRKLGVRAAGRWGAHQAIVEASDFDTDGYRDHGAAERRQVNAKWRWRIGERTRVDTVVNTFDQPSAQDPGGLTRAQWERDPRQAAPAAIAQDARKSVRQEQAGAVLEHRFSDDMSLSGRAYVGQRSLDNALSIAPAAQSAPTASGGIVAFEREFSGAALQLARTFRFGSEASVRVVGGLEHDRMREDRQGYLNTGGVRGALRRDERNDVTNTDAFVQLGVDVASWGATLGARRSRVRFETRDRYIAPGNPDDSGELRYRATNPVLGIAWRAHESLRLYANAGRGFETPTFTEVAYRRSGSGLNADLKASRSEHAEVGMKWRPAGAQSLDVALFDIGTEDEIVVDSNTGGRSTFRNAGRTERRGVEAGYVAPLGSDWRATLSLTTLSTRFGTGRRLPGAPSRSAFGELRYAPARAWAGFNGAIEAVHTGRIFVNDANDDAAPASTLINLRVGFAQAWGRWRVQQSLRLENATDRRYAGSVIVNEALGRYFEPARGRSWTAGLSARYQF